MNPAQAHPVLHRESGISILEILTLVLFSLTGAYREPALPAVALKCSREPFLLEFQIGGIATIANRLLEVLKTPRKN
jgi:hypothetical protein